MIRSGVVKYCSFLKKMEYQKLKDNEIYSVVRYLYYYELGTSFINCVFCTKDINIAISKAIEMAKAEIEDTKKYILPTHDCVVTAPVMDEKNSVSGYINVTIFRVSSPDILENDVIRIESNCEFGIEVTPII